MQLTKFNSIYSLSLIVCAVYFFTGVTALSYEVLWARMLSTIFGVSIFGIVVTISAFMAGLGVGSLLGGRFQYCFKNPLLVFAFIEFAVALFAFNLPVIFSGLDEFIQTLTLGTGYGTWIFVQALVTFFLMFIPALGLGFGFPLILRSLRNSNISLGLVYSFNTLGGMCGALLPLMLLPVFGWIVSDRLVAVFGFLLAFIIFVLSFFIGSQDSLQKADPGISQKRINVGPGLNVLLVYGAIGASAIMLEIGWTRLYGMILLRTEYVMAVILATFLLGIGLGSLLATRMSGTRWLFMLPVIIVISALSSVYFLPAVSAWAETVSYSSLLTSMVQQGGVIALFTLPATLAFGAWLPVLVSSHKNVSVSGAYFYGANSIGGSIGGLVAGFILIPYLGTSVVIAFSAFVVVMASLYWVKDKWFRFVPALTVILFIPILTFPSVKDLLPVSQNESTDLHVYEDALMVTHVIEDKTGQRLLLADLQRMDASTAPDAITVQKNQSRLPLLLHPDPRSILFLGLGTGITASGSLPYPQLTRAAVELSEGAIAASSSWFSEANNGVSGKLLIVKDDARRYLKSTDKLYDVIVGDLFHPDLIGRSNLLSLQQFLRAKKRLADGGLFVQWIALNQFDVDTLKVVLATFRKSFPYASLFVDGFRLALVGSKEELGGIHGIKSSVSRLDRAGVKEITGGEGVWSWAGRYWGPLPETDWALQDEWAPVIEFQLPKAKFNRQLDLGRLLAFLQALRSPPQIAIEVLGVSSDDAPYFEAAHQATDLYYRSWIAYFSGQNLESQKLLSAAYTINPDDQWIGFGMADAMFASINQAIDSGISEKMALNKIIAIRPDHIGALRRLLSISKKEGTFEEVDTLKKQLLRISPREKVAIQ
ncbi:MAG: fused MFS/spermidine synthase [Gammaproteobacteria bacterium]|nr:fused MFS/spermidine synthase [Gammaproteobacteria bacterium]